MTLMADEQKLTEDMSEYVSSFIDKRFSGAVDSPELRVVLSEIIVDAFQDGALWAEQAYHKEHGLVDTDGNAIEA